MLAELLNTVVHVIQIKLALNMLSNILSDTQKNLDSHKKILTLNLTNTVRM